MHIYKEREGKPKIRNGKQSLNAYISSVDPIGVKYFGPSAKGKFELPSRFDS